MWANPEYYIYIRKKAIMSICCIYDCFLATTSAAAISAATVRDRQVDAAVKAAIWMDGEKEAMHDPLHHVCLRLRPGHR